MPARALFPVSDWMEGCTGMLHRYGPVVARDLPSSRERMLDLTNGCRFGITGPGRYFGLSGARASIGGLSVRFMSWDCQTTCETAVVRPRDRDLLLQIPLSGAFEALDARRRVRVAPGQLVLLTAPGDAGRCWQGPSSVLSVMVSRASVERLFASEASHAACLDPLQLTVLDLNEASTLAHAIATVIHDFNDEAPAIADPRIGREFESFLVRLILRSAERKVGGGSVQLAPVMPSYVRRAERHLHDRLAQPVDLASLAQAAGVSVRSIQYAFRRYLNATPMQYLKRLRLRTAYQSFAAATAAAPGIISKVAREVGYRNKSQFSRDYARQFGESPSATLSRTPRQIGGRSTA